MKYIIIILVLFYNFSARADKGCPFHGAEYVPQNQKIKDTYDPNLHLINRTLSFVLNVTKGDGGAGRNTFLNFDAYNKAGKKVSRMRFGNVSSMGRGRTAYTAFYGMYCTFGKDSETDCKNLADAPIFYPVQVNKDFSQRNDLTAPYLIVLQDTYGQLTYTSYNHPKDWDKYIKFYTPERVYPDFRDYDFWVRTKCGEVEL